MDSRNKPHFFPPFSDSPTETRILQIPEPHEAATACKTINFTIAFNEIEEKINPDISYRFVTRRRKRVWILFFSDRRRKTNSMVDNFKEALNHGVIIELFAEAVFGGHDVGHLPKTDILKRFACGPAV